MAVRYTIRTVASRTGLSEHTIRAWERRYSALSPERTETNRRLYGQEDMERLALLRLAVEGGHAIGQVANLSDAELRSLSGSDASPGPAPVDRESPSTYLKAAEHAIDGLDADALERVLTRGGAALGIGGLVETVVLPLTATIGRRWEEGTMRVSHEHMASAVLRTYLERVRTSMVAPTFAPRLLVTTPSGQFHEIGALIVSIVAAMQGWHVTYLGPNLPADEIAAAARQTGVRAVGLSLVYPVGDPSVESELARLRAQLDPTVPILVGGRAAESYREAIQRAGASQVTSLQELRAILDDLRV